jgi:hypothetical protein
LCRVWACSPARVSHLVIVACRKPKTRSAAEASNPSGSRREHHSNLLGRGFQPVQGGVASGTERTVARLAAKGLDRLSTAMLAIPNECMPVCVCDPEVHTLLIWTGEAFGGYPSGVLLGGFSPHSRVVQEQVLALQSTTQERPGDRRGNHLGHGA